MPTSIKPKNNRFIYAILTPLAFTRLNIRNRAILFGQVGIGDTLYVFSSDRVHTIEVFEELSKVAVECLVIGELLADT
jgi:hypothetical protein